MAGSAGSKYWIIDDGVPLKKNTLYVFIASPGDLLEERRVALEVADEVNRIVEPELGWHVVVLRYEDMLPGYGRPQNLINKVVDLCDLFIGLLWKQWGQSTGEYTSGFEEEFERARKRREETGSPEI